MADKKGSKDFIEFDLIINLCGIELNVVSLKTQVKDTQFVNRGNSNNIFQREMFLNLNHVSTKEREHIQNTREK